MADFRFSVIKVGTEGEELKEVVSIYTIIPEPNEKIITIPSHFEGKPVTHIGYWQGKTDGFLRFHDWHHPSQGYDGYEPAKYYAEKCSLFNIPTGVKKIIIPAEVCSIVTSVCNKAKGVTYEISPENKFYEVAENKIVRKDTGDV